MVYCLATAAKAKHELISLLVCIMDTGFYGISTSNVLRHFMFHLFVLKPHLKDTVFHLGLSVL